MEIDAVIKAFEAEPPTVIAVALLEQQHLSQTATLIACGDNSLLL